MGCLSSKPADAATPPTTAAKPAAENAAAAKPADGSDKGTSAGKGEKSKGAASDGGFKEVNLSPGKSASAKSSGKGGAPAPAGTPIAKPSKVDDGVVKELDAAVQSVKPQKGGAKEIPKPKKSGGGGGAADGMAKSKSQRKNARRREKAKQKKKTEGEAGAGAGAPSGGKPPRVGPVVSMERDLY